MQATAPIDQVFTTPLLPAVEFIGAPKALERRGGRLTRGEALAGLLDRLGIDRQGAYGAVASLQAANLVDPRRLSPGLAVTAYVDGETLMALSIDDGSTRTAYVKRGHDGVYRASALDVRVKPKAVALTGTISTSLYVDARGLGAGDQQIVDFASVFAYDVDFQRDIHPGDRFELVYEQFVDERGAPVRTGEVLFAALSGRVTQKAFYRFEAPDRGEVDYFQANGDSATRFLMKTPINGARLSSSFGTRRHPISGYTRLHKGTDFAAPTGTPIFAAGHGVVERASRYGGYGNYIRLRHANGYKTAYAHLSRYGRGIKAGARVRQGQVIGYVGSTGASTGPHLHYEVHIKGKPVNAMALKLPTGRKLSEMPEIMALFEAERARIDSLRAASSSEDAFDTAWLGPPSP
ncbi:MAG: M23 family metallopeptidase [Pseudomonadota bacterium]